MSSLQRYCTFENETFLPNLPVPSLASTVQQTLAALKPIISGEEYEELLREASEFLDNKLIQLIQSHLVAIAENHMEHNNYLHVVNNHMTPAIYSVSKSDILPKNPYLILEDDPYSKTIHPPNQAERAANLVNSSLKFIVTLRNGTLRPDFTPKNKVPLTMSCYRNLFGTSRVPDFKGNSSDVTMRKYSDINESRHIIIIANNQFYKLEVITKYTQEEYQETKSKHKILFHDHELADIFERIIEEAELVDAVESINNAVGSITSQNLKGWKAARFELENSNSQQMKMIDDALFVLIFDSNSPQTDQEKTSVISHGTSVLSDMNVQIGTCTSRWYDKLQLVVAKNSVTGIVWESLTMDSTAILRFISDIYTDSVLKLAKNINGSEYTSFDTNVTYAPVGDYKPEPFLIPFTITKELQHIIHLSETHLADLINQHDYKTHTIKLQTSLAKKFGLSVDSILQICLQITNYSLYGRMVNTLEPITTRKFKDARTELIPVQNEAIATLCKLYITSADANEKFDLFRKCCELHCKQYRDAMIGKGFERHFMSIIQILNKPEAARRLNAINPHLQPIPDFAGNSISLPLLFSYCVETLSRPELLISNCGNPALRLFGIPPAIDRGFGIAYIIHNDKVKMTICSKHRQNDRFLDTFHRVVHDLKINMRSRSSSIGLFVSDSQQRKLEVQKLRIEHELSTTSLDTPTTKHPIQLALGAKTDSMIEVKQNGSGGANNVNGGDIKVDGGSSTTKRKNSSSSENDDEAEEDDYELMGGYGYFEYGNVDLRFAEELARSNVSSHINSQHHSQVSSVLSSRRQSLTNLPKMNDIKHKLSLNERIRDKLLHGEDNIHIQTPPCSWTTTPEETLVQEQQEVLNISPFIGKSSIGRRLDITNYH
ncbi:hypothetical protein KGF56_001606 [Candida oxycetoniae]|uniref:Choline/carnitine acyltransferase domain-containing protein n=1 Tax=Candida oxycetoniae TaxID=497107 RepID=A0AAI9WYX1_9ASCO|nr:uncharacterized protein KGF56_001606 [Candida oxycetoniae]KAI3405588.2 hypothetical protein KGF56_001606 [Candida oxycetoniae]